MRKFLIIIGIFLSLGLASCGTGNQITDTGNENGSGLEHTNTTDNTGSEASDKSSEELQEPEYVKPNFTIVETDTPSVLTPVEETVDKVYDSVVSISVASQTFTGSGSGVLFAEETSLGLSYIVTCFHVIEDCFSISVELASGNTYTASLVGGNKDMDLAVLSIEKTDLTYASFYTDSDKLKLGSQVVCIGNPLGTLPGSVSSGYLSYVNREISVSNYQKMSLLQTDVAINSGNSGGGLFNTSGALIGIVNAKYADEDIEGLGFAIPINTVREVVSSFIKTASYDVVNKKWSSGYVEGDWEFGFTISDGYTGGGFFGNITYVVYVSDISVNTTASGVNALQKGDIIQSVSIDYLAEEKEDIDSLSFKSASTILTALYSADLEIGDTLIFEVSRNNEKLVVSIPLVQYIYSL